MKRIVAFLLTLVCCVSLFGCGKGKESVSESSAPTEPAAESSAPTAEPTAPAAESIAPTVPATTHTHTFGQWSLQQTASCKEEGKEIRQCATCQEVESRPVAKEPHSPGNYNICKNCRHVDFDKTAQVVKLGVICDSWYGSGKMANYVWDLKVWNGKVYRAAGDYDQNSGDTVILAYNIAAQVWENAGSAADEAIHSFEEIGGTLYAPGIDATSGWSWGNYYVLQEDGTWNQKRNLPNGLHCFDMAEHDGKIFAGLGTENTGATVAMSEDGGKSFNFVPLYKDGKMISQGTHKSSRTYEFMKHNGQLYALVYFQQSFGGMYEVYRYEDGKMQYMANGVKLFGYKISRKDFVGEFEFGGACYIASGGLTRITDFSDPETWQKIAMPNKGIVMDAFLRDGVIYTLTYSQNKNPTTHNTESYKTTIYKSTTGEEGSFEEVYSFDYTGMPISFDWDGTCFYIGTGTNLEKAEIGMVLRATPQK